METTTAGAGHGLRDHEVRLTISRADRLKTPRKIAASQGPLKRKFGLHAALERIAVGLGGQRSGDIEKRVAFRVGSASLRFG